MLKHQILLTGIGSYLPKNKTSNNDLAKLMDTSDEWITKRKYIISKKRQAPRLARICPLGQVLDSPGQVRTGPD